MGNAELRITTLRLRSGQDYELRTLSLATALLIATIVFIALAVANGVALDLIGLPIHPWVVLLATVVELAATMAYLWRRGVIRVDAQYDELFAFLFLVAAVAAYLIYPALPALFPPARHFDAVNHALLADYIFEHRTLPHDFSTNVRPYHLSGYPAGGALFGALVAHWTGNLAVKTIHPVISLILGLTAGLVFVLVKRLLSRTDGVIPPLLSTPIAFLTAMLLFTAWDYFPGSVNERYFYAQIFAQFFALSAFLFAFFYWVAPNPFLPILMALSIGTILLSHPTPIVAPTLVAFAAIGLRPGLARRRQAAHVLMLAAGILPYVLAYALPHLSHWIWLTGLGEAVPLSFDSIGYFLPTLSALGFVLALTPQHAVLRAFRHGDPGVMMRQWQRHWRDAFRFPIILLLCALAQPVALYLARFLIPNITGYYFEKSLYLLIYPLALLAAVPLAELARRLPSRLAPKFAWGVVLGLSAIILLAYPPRPFAPMTESEFAVATWAKRNLDVNNIGVVSRVREDAYWIHLLVFDHPSASRVSVGAFHIGSMTFEEWRGNPSEPDYALVRNVARIPQDSSVQTIYRVGDSAILRKPRAEIAAPPTLSRAIQIQVGDLLTLVGYDITDPLVPDSSLQITLYWLPTQWPMQRLSMSIQILDASGGVVARSENEMFQKKFPTQRWPIGVVTTDEWTLPLSADLVPGDYTIHLAVFEQLSGKRLEVSRGGRKSSRGGNPIATERNDARDDLRGVTPPEGGMTPPLLGDEIELGRLRVTIPAPTLEELCAAQEVDAVFGDSIALRAYTIVLRSLRAGDSLRVTLYWASLAPVAADYTVFVHLLDASGRVRAQVDAPPQSGTRPTSTWQRGEIVKDPYRLILPNDLPPGEYRLEIGLYTPADMKRVPVAGNDHIVLDQTITVQ